MENTSQELQEQDGPLQAENFSVVGIGASAGGFEAFKKLVGAISKNSGIAYILIQHLDPTHESILPDLIQKGTTLPVLEITNGILIQPDHIYIVPSNKIVTVRQHALMLEARGKNRSERNLPIDIFLTSLAETYQSNSVGVILSGTGSDGTLGLKAIKENGGFTLTQREDTAGFSGMPQSARLSGVVDFSLPPELIPIKVLELSKLTRAMDTAGNSKAEQEDDTYRQILAMLRIRKGTDFTFYKQTTIRRRLIRRMALGKHENSLSYLKFLRENKDEQDLLYSDLLISVTSFFRDPASFDFLCNTVFPNIIRNKRESEPIRIWVAGCSTGQEAYSMAICIKEFLGDKLETVQIFATDLSEASIVKARNGIYNKSELDGLSEQRLQEFFIKTNEGYQVTNAIRDICVFAAHNFLKDPPFGKIDLVSCRNVLIYMEPFLQKKALTIFHYALNARGYLFLGNSETINSVSDLFGIAHKGDKIFSRKNVPSKFMIAASANREQNMVDVNTKNYADKQGRTDFQKIADELILSKYTPVGVVVNEVMDIVHFRGKTNMYLEQMAGKPSHNILKMAKEGLAFELRNILHKAKKEQKAVTKENIQIADGNGIRQVSIEAMPLTGTVDPHYLILFYEAVDSHMPEIEEIIQSDSLQDRTAKKSGLQMEENLFLKTQNGLLIKELADLRKDMSSITEDQETVNEELQSANEELLSSREELQSLNEELETSKEELQSTNEELSIVNQELLALNVQITEARNYAETIVGTLREPILVLDKNLRVITGNKSFYKHFQLVEKEVEGVLIYHLNNHQWDIPELTALLEQVLPAKSNFTDFEVHFASLKQGSRTMLLNASEILRDKGSDKLILISFEDITERERLHERENRGLNKFQNLVTQAPVAIMILKSLDYCVEFANEYYLRVIEKDKDFIGKPLFDSMPELQTLVIKPILDSIMKTGVPYYGSELEVQLNKKNNNKLGFFNFALEPIRETDGAISGIMIIGNEITEQVLMRKRVESSEERYHNLITTSPSAIGILKGEDLIITTANDAIIEIWGKGRGIMGQAYFTAMPELEEQGYKEIFHRVYLTGTPYNAVETPVEIFQNEKMELKYYNFLLYPQKNINGDIDGIGIIATEVTTQALLNKKIKESEEHYRLLADLMPAKISNFSANGEITYLNNSWLDYSGNNYNELKDFGYYRILHPDELENFQTSFQNAANRGAVLQIELRVLGKDGQYKWHLNTIAPIKDDSGQVKMWAGVSTEIQQQKTEREQLEKAVAERTSELQRSNRQLTQSNEDLQRFAHVASHDLREPLRKVSTYT